MTNKELREELEKWPDDAVVFDRDRYGYARQGIQYVWGAYENQFYFPDDDFVSKPTKDVKYIVLGG